MSVTTTRNGGSYGSILLETDALAFFNLGKIASEAWAQRLWTSQMIHLAPAYPVPTASCNCQGWFQTPARVILSPLCL